MRFFCLRLYLVHVVCTGLILLKLIPQGDGYAQNAVERYSSVILNSVSNKYLDIKANFSKNTVRKSSTYSTLSNSSTVWNKCTGWKIPPILINVQY